jgi:hypothetical protein
MARLDDDPQEEIESYVVRLLKLENKLVNLTDRIVTKTKQLEAKGESTDEQSDN